jgi:tRNA A37 threonylcarbamoyladenosine synthetase subunit TsaC/SUA5/YrdC
VTLISIDHRGLAALAGRLTGGVPVVVPLPSPLPYVVAGTDPGAVNAAKGRPRSQPVGAAVPTLDLIEPALELDPETVDLARWLCFTEQAGVLVPVGAAAPPWLAPATVEGMAFLGGAWLPELSALVEDRTHLYMSSGNATTGRPAATAAEAEAVFGRDLLVADGDAFRDPAAEHGSSTMIAVGPGRQLKVTRPGINNRAFGDDHEAYLADLLRRWR